jgi:type IX secretion system substrate protein
VDATIYAGAGGTNKILSWSVSEGIVAAEPVIIELQDIDNAATSPTVAPSITNDDWFYVSGRGFMPTLFTKEGVNLTQVAISVADFPGTPLAGRTIRCGGRNYMAMFSDNQSAFIFDITNNGENVTDADVLGFTPAFGTEYEGAYGEGAVDFGIIEDQLYVFICGPSNGLACFKVNGVLNTSVEKKITDRFQVSAYPNPATEFANIQFTLPRDASGAVAVKLFDMSGKFMGITANEAQGGPQEMRISTSQLSSGQYIYQVVYKNEISTGKLLTQ